MPGTKKQETAARVALQIKKGKQKPKAGTASAQMARSMTGKDLRDFANLQLPKSHHRK